MKLPRTTLVFWLAIQIVATNFVEAQVLTHGPVVGGVTASDAKVFVRTNAIANVTLRYGADPASQTPHRLLRERSLPEHGVRDTTTETCSGYGLVTVLQNPDRLILEVKDQDGLTHVSHVVLDEIPNPTATPTLQPPMVTHQPDNQTVKVGDTAMFAVGATGTAPLTYQWKKNGVDIAGAVNASYTTPPTIPADNGSLFSVVVSNLAGTATSSSARLNLRPCLLLLRLQPVNKTVRAGHTANFTVTATVTAPLAYQWKKNGLKIAGATKSSYTTPPTTLPDNGAIFAVTVTNSFGTVISNNARLTER